MYVYHHLHHPRPRMEGRKLKLLNFGVENKNIHRDDLNIYMVQ